MFFNLVSVYFCRGIGEAIRPLVVVGDPAGFAIGPRTAVSLYDFLD